MSEKEIENDKQQALDKEEKEKKSKSPDSADYLYICCIIFGIDRLYCTFCCGR